jgi:ATP-dependent RNA helicase DOB1
MHPQVRQLSESVVHKTTLRNMRRLLRKLGFLTADGVVTLKGRVACEISTADELLSSELLFGGMRRREAVKQQKAKFLKRVWMQCLEEGEWERQT